MINIILSDMYYENDVYPLVKAFYPEELINVCRNEEQHKKVNNHTTELAKDTKNVDVNENSEKQKSLTIEFAADLIKIIFSSENEFHIAQELSLDTSLLKPQYKNTFKRFLYDILSKTSGRVLPWGILTGIRPAKLVYEMLEKGEDEIQINQIMKDEYYCSDAKIELIQQIAQRELNLLGDLDYKNGYSIYIGIPFCPSTCLYCSFTSYSIAKYSDLVEDYLKALEKEINYCSDCMPNKKLTTVYFGGGTPTTLTAEQLDRVLGLVRDKFDFTYVKEFCVEAGRPDSITREKLEVLKKWGVNRISINPQSMQQKTLDIIGRQHTVEDIYKAFELARETGHDNINMDIIIGLPGEKPEDVTDTLAQIKLLNPDSLTVHTLALKRAARLNIQKENYVTLKASGVPQMHEKSIRFAKENAYLPYYLYRQKNMADNLENIGYARFGKEGIYNILIMEEKQTILALGAGGMSKFVIHDENRIERVDNVKSVVDYIGRTDEMIKRKKDFIDNNYSIL